MHNRAVAQKNSSCTLLTYLQLYQWLSIFFVRRNHDKIVDKIVFEKFTRGEKVNGRRTRKPVSQRWKVGAGRKKQKKLGEKGVLCNQYKFTLLYDAYFKVARNTRWLDVLQME